MEIDGAALDAAVAKGEFSGLVSVHEDGRRKFARAEGHAHRAHGVPNTAETRFAIASGSKMFTALAAIRLAERGDLALDEPVRRWLRDDLPLVDPAVTMEHLLSHVSGIGDYLDEEAGGDIDEYVLTRPVHTLLTAEDFLPELAGHPQQEAPGETFRYNNGGFMVAALVLERVAGQPYQDVVAREVFARAGLERTAFDRSDALPGDVATGYLDAAGDRTNVLHLPVRGNGDGGAIASADDLDRLWHAFADGEVVAADAVAEMTRPRHDAPEEGLRYGMGVWLHADRDLWVIEGYDAGVSFRSTFDPAKRVTVSVLGNTSEGAWPVIGALATMLDTQ